MIIFYINVTLDHKTSHKGQFEIEIYTSSESWINKLSNDLCFVRNRIGQYLAEIWNLRVKKKKKKDTQNIEKLRAFKVVQMKPLEMHITI